MPGQPKSRSLSALEQIRRAGIYASANFTPAAAAYSAGDIIDTAKEFAFAYADGSPVDSGSLIRITSTVLKIGAAALIASEGAYTLQNYGAAQTTAQADNDPWTLTTDDLAAYRGALALGTPVDLGGALYVKTQLTDQQDIRLIGTSLFSRLVTTPGLTFAAVARQVTLYGVVL
jgi:hypothetical protein